MTSAVPFTVKYRASSALVGALQRRAPRAAEDTEISFEELCDKMWSAAPRQEEKVSYWKARSKKIRERLALEAEIYAERQRQQAINQEIYAQNLQQQQINERIVLSEQGLEPGMIGLISLVLPIMQGTEAPILH